MEILLKAIERLVENHGSLETLEKTKEETQKILDYQNDLELVMKVEKELANIASNLETQFLLPLKGDLASIRSICLDTIKSLLEATGSVENLQKTCRFRQPHQCSSGPFQLCKLNFTKECNLNESQLDKFLKLYSTLVCANDPKDNPTQINDHLNTILGFLEPDSEPKTLNSDICNLLRKKDYVIGKNDKLSPDDIYTLLKICIDLFQEEQGVHALDEYQKFQEAVKQNPFNPIKWLSPWFRVFKRLVGAIKENTWVYLILLAITYFVVSQTIDVLYNFTAWWAGFAAPRQVFPEILVKASQSLPESIRPGFLESTVADVAETLDIDVEETFPFKNYFLGGISDEERGIFRQTYEKLGPVATDEEVIRSVQREFFKPAFARLTAANRKFLASANPTSGTTWLGYLYDLPVISQVGNAFSIISNFSNLLYGNWRKEVYKDVISGFRLLEKFLRLTKYIAFGLAGSLLILKDTISEIIDLFKFVLESGVKITWNVTIARLNSNWKIHREAVDNDLEKIQSILTQVQSTLSEQTKANLEMQWRNLLEDKNTLHLP